MFRFTSIAILLTILIPIGANFSSSFSSREQWSDDELSILRSLSLSSLRDLPPSVSNAVADHPLAQQLGRDLFFDPSLSSSGKISCASCHNPDNYFTDSLAVAEGIGKLTRNTPTIVGVARQRWLYWDGRRDSLWAQAITPFEAAEEMGSSRLAVVRKVTKDPRYSSMYKELFGNSTIFSSLESMPEDAGPIGDTKAQSNWYRIPAKQQDQINIAFSNIGKTIAAYERTLEAEPTRFDAYVNTLISGGKTDGMITRAELNGIKLFIDENKTSCLQCHNGPLLSHLEFSNVGTGNFGNGNLDFGREFGYQAVLLDEFNCRGRYSDADPQACSQLRFLNKTAHIPRRGAFKVPSLRQLASTAPYFHDGRFSTLSEVLDHYSTPPTNNGAHELTPLNLRRRQLNEIEAFLLMLNNPMSLPTANTME